MTDRVWALAMAIALVCGGFLARLFQLQVVDGAHYAQVVDHSRLEKETLPPLRGRILDRTGQAMADTRAIYHLGVVFGDLELIGRARRDTPLYRLDERRFDAFVADLAMRLRWIGRATPLKDALMGDLLAHPGVALRQGERDQETRLALVALPRRVLSPQPPAAADDDPAVDPGDPGRLAESDLLTEDPRDALAREIAARWTEPVQVIGEEEFQAACAQLDAAFGLGQGNDPGRPAERCAPVLDPFTSSYALRVPLGEPAAVADAAPRARERRAAGTPPSPTAGAVIALRLFAPERRQQAELTLARVLGEDPAVVRERLDRALAAARRPGPASQLYYASSADAEAIAPLLPRGSGLLEIPMPEVPGARERIVIIQGDPPQAEGLYGQIVRGCAATLEIAPDLFASLLEKHAQVIRAQGSEREYGTRHLVLDAARLGRLTANLTAALTRLARPATQLEVQRSLAEARRAADHEWAGQSRFDPIALFKDVPQAVAVRLSGANTAAPGQFTRDYDDAGPDLPGLTVQMDVGRAYPFPGSSSHVIGLLGRSREGERPSVQVGDLIGRSGLEATYDERLRGVPGSRTRLRTPDGFRVLDDDPALPGGDLVTEIDMEMQTLAEDSLHTWFALAQQLGTATEKMERAREIGRGRAGFVMIDCHTGGILTLASAPGFSIGDVRTRYGELVKDPSQPLIDHACEPDQAPGSSFKILTALACLENGVLNPGEEIATRGYMAMFNGRKVLRDHAPPGDYDLPRAIQYSSNCYFATIAERLARRHGNDVLPAFALKFGLGRRSALDVFQQREHPRTLPTPAMLPAIRPAEPKWRTADTWHLGMGQFCAASPLQCVTIAAAVANGGHVVTPFLVRPAGGPVVGDLHIRREWLDEVRRGMELVTANQDGSTAKLLVLQGEAAGIKVAAKTGTAEWGPPAERETRFPDHAWMIGYAPADRPTVAFACFVHSGTFGGSACTPVIKRVLERYFAKYGKGGHGEAGASAPVATAPPAVGPAVGAAGGVPGAESVAAAMAAPGR